MVARKGLLVCLGIVWIAASIGAALPVAAAEPASARLEKEIESLRRQIEELERQVASLRAAQTGGGGAGTDIAELEKRIEALSRDLEQLRVGDAAGPVAADKSEYGFGPAASKVYRTKQGLSVGGYGEMLAQSFADERDDGVDSGRTDEVDFLRAVLYFGYKFNDRILFNSEIEFEHATTGEGDEEKGEVSVEFAYLDFRFHPTFNARTGLLLVPVGFINELHEPPVFHGARRPEVETQILPTTWRENGAGIFGDFGPFSYRVYAMASLDGRFLNNMNLRDTRQSGSHSSIEDIAFAGRVDLTGVPGVLAGVSVFTGETGLGNFDGGRVTLADLHAEWKWKGLELRGLLVRGIVSDVDVINAEHLTGDGAADALTGDRTVGERLLGWYGQAAYDVLAPIEGTEQQLFPFVRYERVDTQNRVPGGFSQAGATDRQIVTSGVTYKPIPQVVIKVDYQNFNNDAATGVDQFNLAVGYLF